MNLCFGVRLVKLFGTVESNIKRMIGNFIKDNVNQVVKPPLTTKKNLNREDFPSSLRIFNFQSSMDGLEENILLLFHGLGDNEKNFVTLAKQMNLPQTSSIAIRAPISVPLVEEGFCWIPSLDPIHFTFITKSPERLNGLKILRNDFHSFLDTLESRYNYLSSRIFLMGFSQGATVALDVALHYKKLLGGVIAISGGLLDEYMESAESFNIVGCNVPILMTHGIKDDKVSIQKAQAGYQYLISKIGNKETVQWHEYAKGHTMICSKEEMKDLMQFFSRHLFLRSSTLENHPDIIECKSVF